MVVCCDVDVDDEDPKEYLKNPYCADPVWQPWHADAPDVQGGADDESTSEEEEDPEEGSVALRTLPDACICGNCRCRTVFSYPPPPSPNPK